MRSIHSAALALVALLTPWPALAAAITLKVADALPSGHIAHRYILQPFMEGVTRRTNGEIKFQHFPGEQLGKAKDMLIMEQSGVTDIALTVPSYISDKLPLTAAAELPGAFRTVCEAAHAYRQLTRDGQVLAKYEYGANRVRALMSFPIAPSALIVSSTRKVGAIADLAGMKIRTSGGAHDLTVRELGGVSIRMSPPEVYESMQRGTIDGALFPIPSVISYDLTNLTKSASNNVNFGGIILTYSISESKWRTLTPEQQQIVAEEADTALFEGCKKLDAELIDGTRKIEAAGGRFFAFDDADVKKFDAVFEDVRRDWSANLDKRGKPGSEVLAAWTAAVKAARDNPSQ